MVLDAPDEAVEVVSLLAGRSERAVEEALVAGLYLILEPRSKPSVLAASQAQSVDGAGEAEGTAPVEPRHVALLCVSQKPLGVLRFEGVCY